MLTPINLKFVVKQLSAARHLQVYDLEFPAGPDCLPEQKSYHCHSSEIGFIKHYNFTLRRKPSKVKCSLCVLEGPPIGGSFRMITSARMLLQNKNLGNILTCATPTFLSWFTSISTNLFYNQCTVDHCEFVLVTMKLG